MEECFEVDEFRSVVLVKLTEVLKDILFDIFHQILGPIRSITLPELVKPRL